MHLDILLWWSKEQWKVGEKTVDLCLADCWRLLLYQWLLVLNFGKSCLVNKRLFILGHGTGWRGVQFSRRNKLKSSHGPAAKNRFSFVPDTHSLFMLWRQQALKCLQVQVKILVCRLPRATFRIYWQPETWKKNLILWRDSWQSFIHPPNVAPSQSTAWRLKSNIWLDSYLYFFKTISLCGEQITYLVACLTFTQIYSKVRIVFLRLTLCTVVVVVL